MHLAAFYGKVENVKALIEGGANVNAIDDGGYTALHSASLMSCEKTVRELIKAGSNVNTGNYIGRTPLHEAVFMREIVNVRAILEAGGDVNAKDQKGYTPLHIACKTGETKEIIKELVKAGANVEQKDKFGKTAMYYARTEELLEKLRELSERTVDAIFSLDLKEKGERRFEEIREKLEEAPLVKKALMEVEKELEDMDEKIKGL
ncbi:ankyrin repeat domain-containing protein [Wolbachia endosymbiont (group A) of Myopa testacea]|uniref:ankyrin repeat domain-containing protein n=1 Tax=Wolbachia endosymbiont (group A) of Myopa testacea TaxID=3066148 RepID=UPI0033426F58